MTGKRPLTDKQQVFIEEYLVDLNATQAAIRAGYSEHTAKDIGCGNLAKPYIKEAIQELMAERSKRTEITADKVLQELAKLGFSNMKDYTTVNDEGMIGVDMSDLTDDQYAAITEVTVDTRKEHDKGKKTAGTIEKVKFKLADKGQNLERLGRHLKLFTDRTEHSGNIGLTDLTEDQLDAKIKMLLKGT